MLDQKRVNDYVDASYAEEKRRKNKRKRQSDSESGSEEESEEEVEVDSTLQYPGFPVSKFVSM
jgi:hypothetical protein